DPPAEHRRDDTGHECRAHDTADGEGERSPPGRVDDVKRRGEPDAPRRRRHPRICEVHALVLARDGPEKTVLGGLVRSIAGGPATDRTFLVPGASDDDAIVVVD